jgi:hypothetical protein
MEMPGLWKAWKAKVRLPTLSTSPLEISPPPGEIPTFPQRRRRGRMEKWKTQNQVFHFLTAPTIEWEEPKKRPRRAGLRPAARRRESTKGDFLQPSLGSEQAPGISGSPRIGIEPLVQAHPALESNLSFRLIPHWNRFSISGSFLDWKMLRHKRVGEGRRDFAPPRPASSMRTSGSRNSPTGRYAYYKGVTRW